MRSSLKSIIILLALFYCVSCVTDSTYGATFKAVEESADHYTLKIYYGGPPPQFAMNVDFQEGTSSKLYEEAQKFLLENPEYKSYEIVNIKHSNIPSYFLYEVRFLREE